MGGGWMERIGSGARNEGRNEGRREWSLHS